LGTESMLGVVLTGCGQQAVHTKRKDGMLADRTITDPAGLSFVTPDLCSTRFMLHCDPEVG